MIIRPPVDKIQVLLQVYKETLYVSKYVVGAEAKSFLLLALLFFLAVIHAIKCKFLYGTKIVSAFPNF